MTQLPKIVLVDDHTLFREGLRLLIEEEKLGEVIAEAENGKEFIGLLGIFKPDMVLIDIEMPIMGGLEATIMAKAIYPDLKILVLTMQSSKDDYINFVNAGAVGFILKTTDKKELENAIQSVLQGENYYSKEILQNVIKGFISNPLGLEKSKSKNYDLTDREKEVLMYLCDGLTPTEIASAIHRSVKTVEAHRAKLLEKTNTKNTINLVLYAIKNKLVEL